MNKKLFILFAMSLPLLYSCKTSTEVSETKTVVLDTDTKLWGKLNLNVCWLNKGEDTKIFREKVELFVTTNFDKTILKLRGWKSCSNDIDQDDIRILIFDGSDSPFFGKPAASGEGHPRVLAFGKEIRQKTPGLILTMNFTAVQGFLVNIANNLSSSGKTNLLLSVALHEFGHAVGLYHENTHPDSDCTDWPEVGPRRAVTDFVKDSFMNRCYYRRTNYEVSPLSMSQGDIDGINKTYSFNFRGSWVWP